MIDIDALERWTQKIATSPETDWQEAGRVAAALIQRLRAAEKDRDYWGRMYNTRLEKSAQDQVRIAKLGAVARTVYHLDTVGVIKLDPDTRRELADALVEELLK